MINLLLLILIACLCCVAVGVVLRSNMGDLKPIFFLLFAGITFFVVYYIAISSKIIWTERAYYDKFNRVEYIDQIYVKPTSSSILIPFDSLRTTPYGKNE